MSGRHSQECYEMSYLLMQILVDAELFENHVTEEGAIQNLLPLARP